jgi:phosphoserine phosphatase
MRDEWDKWVVTLLGHGDLERGVSPVIRMVKEQGLELDFIETPAGMGVGTAGGDDASYGCARVVAYGRMEFEAQMREDLLRLADDIALDLVLQRESERKRSRRLFVFDMDSTLIQGEVIDELAKMAGVADRVVAITASAMRGEIEFQESFRRRVALLAGLAEARAHELLERIPLMPGAERLFRELKARGVKTAVLSGGFTFFGVELQRRLGVDWVHANELDVDAVGLVTGAVRGTIVDGARKAALLEEIAGREGIALDEVVAVGDGANDLPMLRLAGMGVAFHAKPVVRAAAQYAMTHAGLDGLLELVK